MTTQTTPTKKTTQQTKDQTTESAITTNAETHQFRKTMHEDVPTWCDVCCCETEPYWQEAMEADADADDTASTDSDGHASVEVQADADTQATGSLWPIGQPAASCCGDEIVPPAAWLSR